MFRLLSIAALLLTINTLSASIGTVTVDVPKTAYIQWIENSSDTMTAVNGDNTTQFIDYVGGPVTQLLQPVNKKTYIAVMCNSLAGYDLTFTASNAGATASSGNMTIAGGQNLQFNCTLSKVSSSFSAGTTASTALDLTGATPSATAVYTAEADLPMTDASPNVWELDWGLPVITTVSDGLIMSGTYLGGVTVTVTLK